MQLMAISPIKTVDFYLSLNQELYPDLIERQVRFSFRLIIGEFFEVAVGEVLACVFASFASEG
jgi:hypothetical protein